MEEEINEDFQRLSREKQETYRKFFGNREWEHYDSTQHDDLKRKLAYAFFRSSNAHDPNTAQGKFIDAVFDLIIKTKEEHQNKDSIWITFVCVCCRINDNLIEYSVLRVPKYDGDYSTNEDMFIDAELRVYRSWEDFLSNNKLPPCTMCYPTRGKYHRDQLQLDTCESPEAKLGNKVLKFLDTTVPEVRNLAASIGLSSSLPEAIAKLVVTVGTSAYSIWRSSSELHDRHKHQQSIGLDNPEARRCYLGITTNLLQVAASSADVAIQKSMRDVKAIKGKRLNKDAESVKKSLKVAFVVIAGSQCLVSSFTIGNEVAGIVQKVRRGEELGLVDLYQVASCVFFFANCVISTRDAFKLIKTANKDKSDFFDLIMNRTETNKFQKVLNVMNCISTTYRILNKLVNERILLRELWENFNKEMTHVKDLLYKCFGKNPPKDDGSGGPTYFPGENLDFIDAVASTIVAEGRRFHDTVDMPGNNNSTSRTATRDQYPEEIIEIARKFADREECTSPDDFMEYLKFACNFVRKESLKKKNDYEKALSTARKFSPNVSVEDFDREYGIQTSHSQYFLEQVIQEFKTGNGFLKLQTAYSHHKKDPTQEKMQSNSVNFSYIAIDNEEGLAPDGWLSRSQYLEKARQVLNEVNEENAVIEDDGSAAIIVLKQDDVIIHVATTKKTDGTICGIAIMLRKHKLE